MSAARKNLMLESRHQLYQQGKLTLAGLREVAPLIAAAVDKQRQRDGLAWE